MRNGLLLLLSSLTLWASAPARALAQAFEEHPAGFAPLEEVYADTMGGGVAFVDVDGDGWDDVLVTRSSSGVRLYRNGGPEDEFRFTDVTLEANLPEASGAGIIAVAAADLDGDGAEDLVLGSRRGNLVYANDGTGVFRDASGGAFTGSSTTTGGFAVADLDRDGVPDVFAVGYILISRFPHHVCWPDQLLLGRGDLTFDEVAARTGVADPGCGLAAMALDYDLDGDLDLAIANDFGPMVTPNALYRNDGLDEEGLPLWTDVGETSGFGLGIYGMGLAAADVNADGYPDVFSTSIGRTLLMVSDGAGGFVDRADEYGVAGPYGVEGWRVTWGATFLDVENDGLPDLAVAAGQLPAAPSISSGPLQPDALYLGLSPDGPARDVAAQHGVDATDNGHGVIRGDFDRDGRADLLVTAIGGPVHLYRNVTEGVAGASLRLTGTVSGTDAVGARVTLTCAGASGLPAIQNPTGSYLSQSSALIVVPLIGCDGEEPTARIDWPSGVVSTVALPPEGGPVEAVEPAWLVVAPDWLPADGASSSVVVVTPRDEQGAPLGPGHDVTITADDLAVSAVTDLGDGSYTASLTAPDAVQSAVRIEVSIDGLPVPHRPRLRFYDRDRTILEVSQHHMPAEDVQVFFRPRDAEGEALGAGLDVDFAMEGGSMVDGPTDLGDGSYRAVVRDDDPTTDLTVQGRVQGEVRATASSVLVPRVDPATTIVTVFPAYLTPAQALGEDVVITIHPRNALGEVPRPSGLPLVLIGASGAEVVPSEDVDYRVRSILVRVHARTLHDESPVEVSLDGVVLARTAKLVYYDDPIELIARVDEARSNVSAYQYAAYSGGQDFVWVVGELRDADGDGIPVPPSFSLSSAAGGTPFDLRIDGAQFEGKVRTPEVAGSDEVRIGWSGEQTAAAATVVLAAPAPAEQYLEELDLDACVTTRAVAADGASTIELTVRPRDGRTGLLAGPNVPVEVGLGAEVGVTPVTYVDVGTYRVVLGPTAAPASGRLDVSLPASGVTASFELAFLDPADPLPAPEPACLLVEAPIPEEDAGPAAEPDAGGPMADAGLDAGSDRDAGVDMNGDAGVPPDADAGDSDPFDAGPNAGPDDPVLPPRYHATGGCACRTSAARAGAPPWGWGALILVAVWRRRRG